jgi:O-antigen/teichoic acid export membrane protein
LFKYSLIISFPIAVGTAILSERFILLFYGSEYLPSVIALQILIWSNVIIFANFTPRLFEAINKQIIFTKITMLGAIVNVILNLLLIPQFSYVGAATATCLTEFIILIPSFIIFSKTEYRFSGSFAFKNVLKIFIAGVCMGCFVKYFYDINLAVLIVLSALIYIVLLYLVKMFDETDIDIIRNLIKGKVNTVDKVLERQNRR